MSLQHQVCCTHIILTAVFKELDLERYKWRGQHVRWRKEGGNVTVMITVNVMPLTDFLTVVGQPSSNTGPLSVLLILNRSEKLIGRM